MQLRHRSRFITLIAVHIALTLPILTLPALAGGSQGGSFANQLRDKPIPVNTSNFVRAETAAQFDRMVAMADGINLMAHLPDPTPLDQQNVIRMNRDTLYSFAIVNISDGATLMMPDAGDRYMSTMIVNEDHYINKVFYGGGTYELTTEEFDTPFVLVAVRTLVDASDPDDVKAGNALQDQMTINAVSSGRYRHPNYDDGSYEEVYDLLLKLSAFLPDSADTFGAKDSVDPIRHMLGTAFGWGGLPEEDAYYLNVEPGLPVGEYKITVGDVPVDAFWSISMYNQGGYFEPNSQNAYSVNNLTGQENDDGSVTIHLGGCEDNRLNCLPLTQGWNYVVRLYRPRQEILDGTWVFPVAEPVH